MNYEAELLLLCNTEVCAGLPNTKENIIFCF